MNDVTYGDLMARALGYTMLGLDELQHRPCRDAAEVYQSAATLQDLLHALASHAEHLVDQHLLGPGPNGYHLVRANLGTGNGAGLPQHGIIMNLPQHAQAAILFTNSLHSAAGERQPYHVSKIPHSSAAGRLRTATVAVRAATELLATHRTPDGDWRTPESKVLENFTATVGCVRRVARLAIMLADAQLGPLTAMLSESATEDRAYVGLLPNLATVRDTATQLCRHIDPSRATKIDVTTVATRAFARITRSPN